MLRISVESKNTCEIKNKVIYIENTAIRNCSTKSFYLKTLLATNKNEGQGPEKEILLLSCLQDPTTIFASKNLILIFVL